MTYDEIVSTVKDSIRCEGRDRYWESRAYLQLGNIVCGDHVGEHDEPDALIPSPHICLLPIGHSGPHVCWECGLEWKPFPLPLRWK